MLGRHVAAMLPTPSVARLANPLRTTFTTRLAIRIAPVAYRRLYATPGRPRKTAGEGTAAKKTTTKSTAAKKKPTAAAKAAKKTKDAEAKKAKAAKAKAAKAVKTAAAKEKAKARADKKKVAAQAVKTRAAEKKAKAKAKENSEPAQLARLKKVALLDAPSIVRASAYTIFITENADAYKARSGSAQESLGQVSKQMAARYRSLSQIELQEYQAKATEQAATSKAEFARWVASRPVEEIKAANSARAALRRKTAHPRRYPAIADDRSKRSPSSYIVFYRERLASDPQLASLPVAEAAKQTGAAWRALSDAEKQSYKSSATTSSQRYDSVFDSSSSPQQASATA